MKKIVLGCAAVLLSLGLLAGCNNEEKAVSISVDSAATVVVGESLELPYTVEPEKADVVAESSNESILEAVAQDGILYLEGIAEGSASVTLMGTYKKYTDAFASVSVTVTTKATEDTGPGEEEPGGTGGEGQPGEQVITLSGVPETLDVALDGEATITPVATPAGAEIGYVIDEPSIVSLTNTATVEGEYEFTVTPLEEGTTNIVFTASLDDYEDVTATIAVTVHEEGWEPDTGSEPNPDPETGTASNVTLILNLYEDESAETEYVLPAWLDLYMYGSWMDDTNLSTESNAVKLTYHGDNDASYGNYYSLTIEGEIAFDTYEYHLFVVYNDGMNKDVISWGNDVYTGWFDINYAGDGYDYRLTWTVTEDLETEYPDPNAVGTVEQQTNHKINFFFVDDADTPGTYYDIPSYADGYLCGYFTGSNWTEYTIGGNTKLTANGATAEDGYSVTLDTVDTGSREVNIYFEFNSTAQNHTAATGATWNADHSVFGSGNGHIIIDNTQGATESDVYIECNPSNVISDEADFCDLIVRVIDSGNSGKTLYISGINDWTSHTMTAVTGQDYQYEYEDASVDKGSSLEFGIYNDSSWGDSLKFATEVSGSYWNSGNDICFDGSHTNYDTTIITLTADCSVMGTSTTHASITNVSITH